MTAGRTQSNHKGRCLLSRSCYGTGRLHARPWNSYQSQHPHRLFVHCFTDARAEDEPAETSPTPGPAPSDMPAINLQPSHQAASKLLLQREAVLSTVSSFLLCWQTPPVLREERNWDRDRWVPQLPLLSITSSGLWYSQAPYPKRAPGTTSLSSPPPSPAPRAHSSWGFIYGTFQRDTCRITQIYSVTETYHLPLCCTNQSLQAPWQRGGLISHVHLLRTVSCP